MRDIWNFMVAKLSTDIRLKIKKRKKENFFSLGKFQMYPEEKILKWTIM